METTKETSIDARIALIYTNIEKLIKHFKLDRHSKSNHDDSDAVSDATDEEDSKMLREILKQVGDLADRKEFTVEQVAKLEKIVNGVANYFIQRQDEKHKELTSAFETIRQQIGELKIAIEKIGQNVGSLKDEKRDSTVTHHHRHSIEVKSSKVLLTLIGLSVALVGSAVLHVVQYLDADKFRDNDMKYRCIQMQDGATPADIDYLREVFEFHRDPEVIKTIRHRVEEYEQLVKQEAENTAKARFNSAEAERLKKEAETVKDGAATNGMEKGGAAKVKK